MAEELLPRRQRKCVHIQCSNGQHARSVCKRHYDLLHGFIQGKAKRPAKRELEPINLRNIDYDDYWAWVKAELNITT